MIIAIKSPILNKEIIKNTIIKKWLKILKYLGDSIYDFENVKLNNVASIIQAIGLLSIIITIFPLIKDEQMILGELVITVFGINSLAEMPELPEIRNKDPQQGELLPQEDGALIWKYFW